jgi:hypothetical protein
MYIFWKRERNLLLGRVLVGHRGLSSPNMYVRIIRPTEDMHGLFERSWCISWMKTPINFVCLPGHGTLVHGKLKVSIWIIISSSHGKWEISPFGNGPPSGRKVNIYHVECQSPGQTSGSPERLFFILIIRKWMYQKV